MNALIEKVLKSKISAQNVEKAAGRSFKKQS